MKKTINQVLEVFFASASNRTLEQLHEDNMILERVNEIMHISFSIIFYAALFFGVCYYILKDKEKR